MRKERGGCARLISFVLLLCLIAAVYNWPAYVDKGGSQTTGTLIEKRETVHVHYGDWYRHFEIIATFTLPDQRLEHRAGCNVDEQTYDSLHIGNSVGAHYLPNLLNQPFIPATHLSPCTSWATINGNPAVIRGLVVAFAILLAILFIWRVLRIRMAGWLLLPWAGLLFAYAGMPETEPTPKQPKAAQATIWSIDTVSRLMESDDDYGIKLDHPYQIVQLKFVPDGMDAPVVAIDKIDLDSVPNLRQGQTVDIVYDVVHPRIARLRGGVRVFPSLARRTVWLTAAAFLGFLLIVSVVGWLLRLLVRNPLVRAAKPNATLRQQRRRW